MPIPSWKREFEKQAARQMNVAAKKPQEKKIEAYGVKGMQSRPWRKVFKNTDALEKWVDKNDAEVHGTRDVD